MISAQTIIHEQELSRIQDAVTELVGLAHARAVFVIDRSGQLIAGAGEVDNLDTTSLASLTAGNIAATGGMAELLREHEFATQFHEGKNAHIYIQLVDRRVILVVIFDARSSLGLVRLRARKTTDKLAAIFAEIEHKASPSPDQAARSPFAEITDTDIDTLFND